MCRGILNQELKLGLETQQIMVLRLRAGQGGCLHRKAKKKETGTNLGVRGLRALNWAAGHRGGQKDWGGQEEMLQKGMNMGK